MTPATGQLCLLLALFLALLSCSLAQQDFSEAPIPDPFRRGDRYPLRSEIEVCRPIQDYINRGSQRFDAQLVTNNNPAINFATADSRIMSSRLQSRLNTLASNFYSGRNSYPPMTVLKAWTEFPDPELSSDRESLHYEGRTIRVRLQGGSRDDYSHLLTAAVDAQFDWVSYETDNYVRLSVIPSSCDRNIDVVFILDQSGSVGSNNNDLALQFITNVVSFFTIGLSNTRVGLVTYSTDSRIRFDLNDRTTLASVISGVQSISYPGGWTATALALNHARQILDPSRNRGARPASEGIPKIAILITDGKSNQYSITNPANNLKNSGVQVYTIGVGNYDLSELRFISSDPDDEHVFLLDSYRDAIAFVDFLSVTTCESQAIVGTCEITESSVPQDSLQYYQADCDSFHSTILVQLTDISGSSSLYCSTAANNPGPLTDNTISDERTGVSTRQCVITNSGNIETVYVGVQGQGTMNDFSLVIMDNILLQTSVTSSVVEGDPFTYDLSTLLVQGVRGQSWVYTIEDGNVNNVFEIANGRTFRIRSDRISVIDFETQPQYNVISRVERSGSACSCSRIRIQLDVITNRVDFTVDPAVTSVSEDAPIGTEVVTVTATSGAGQISYSITAGNTGNVFSIDSSSGVVEVASSLNFEDTQSYTLTVRADVSGTSVSDTTNIPIQVVDVNESPFFTTGCAMQGSCSFSLDENEPAGTGVGNIEADDPDLDTVPNGMLSYSISPLNDYFSINQMGAITTTQMLDFEDSSSHSFNVIVRDSSISISTAVVVTVNDLNDNTPLISGETEVSIDENAVSGFPVVQYSATDADSPPNDIIMFSITSSSGFIPFDIDDTQGLLYVTGSVDYEMVQEYSVTVTASNPGTTHSSSITTRITVNNLNDNRPRFVGGPYSGTVVEHADVGTEVLTLQAEDDDLGTPGMIRFSIINGNFQGSFVVNEVTGIISVARDIDREVVNLFSLRVRVTDLGNPAQRRGLTVPITVTDINDHSPVFNPSTYSAEVREDTPVNTELFTVSAFDNDEQGNPNSMISYSITDGNVGTVFSINSDTGVISLVSSVDFESLASYTLTIVATDQGSPPRTGMATASVTVTDVNDVPPSVNGSISIVLSESAPVGIVVVDYDAIDPDSTVTFSIDSGNEEGKFEINGMSGQITLIESLDFETTQLYTLTILVSDGQLSTTSDLSVNVLDENDFAPAFEGLVDFEVEEESDNDTLIGTVRATDMDGTSPNNMVTYAFAQMSAITQYISLNSSSGEIRTVGVLDREQLTQIFVPPLSRQSVTIVARDGGSPSKQSSRTITITLLDINDHSPVFGDSSYQNSLTENLPPNQTVFQLPATDEDLGTNAEIRFSFVVTSNAGDAALFQMDEVSGVLETIESLDCEQRASYTFNLIAMDLGNSPRSSTVTGVLNVIDENDNSPIFTMNPYNVSISEAITSGSVISQVLANDADKGLNGEVVYTVINEETMVDTGENELDVAPFVLINSTSGEITLDTEFNFERQQQYTVTVVARDRGVPRRSASAQVIFNIQNFDEAAPVFPDVCEFTVSENSSLNTVIAECIATDDDNIATSPDQVLVNYTIFSGNDEDIFAIDANTGGISLVKALDRETTISHSLTIRAVDLTGLTSFREVNIFVSDENDNSPQFIGSPYSFDFTISRIQDHVQEIFGVSASDEDIGENGRITYSITNIMRDELRTTIEIAAEDGGSSPRRSLTQLVVNFMRRCSLQEYGIDSSSGRVFGSLLCSVSISPNINVTLGGSNTFTCDALYNSPLTYQWIHNGSLITASTELLNRQRRFGFTVSEARHSDQGEYACKVSTSAGSLQSITSTANIQVPPRITVAPMSVAAREGESITLECRAVGLPEPIIEWFRGTEKVAEGPTLVIENTDSSRAGVYSCAATNSDQGNPAVAVATITLYGSENVVQLRLTGISNPSENGSCHYINYNAITSTIETLTRQTALVAGVEGANICEVTPCTPNPCENRGDCTLDDTSQGGYRCSCPDGYTGRNCADDVQECAENPCGRGSCVEQVGSFQCMCATGTHGHRCQYRNFCETSNNCTSGTLCVDLTGGGFTCVTQPNTANSLVIRGLGIDSGFLNDLIQAYLERQAFSRRKREITIVTFCEPRFVEIANDAYALVWICQSGDPPPSLDSQAILCAEILGSGHVQTCAPPGGDEMMVPTNPPLSETTATVEVIVVRTTSRQPLNSDLIVAELEQRGGQQQISTATGATVNSITSQPTVINGGPAPENTSGVAAGVAIGVLLALCLVAALVVGAVVGVIKYRDHVRRQQRKRDHAIEKAISLHSLDSEQHYQSPPQPVLKSSNSTAELLDNDHNRNQSGSPEDPSTSPPITNSGSNGEASVITNDAAVDNEDQS